jgi:two-component system phosphate regulon sensor histidine kinase PhoR
MKNSTIRLLLILALVVSSGIMITQTYWVRRAYALKEAEFNLKVQEALIDVAQNIMVLKEVQVPNLNPVERLSDKLYIVQVNVHVEQDVLKHYLDVAFRKYQVVTNYQYGLYDCMNGVVQYQELVHQNNSAVNASNIYSFPNIERENYYFVVYLPNGSNNSTSDMSIWVISSVVLLIVIGFLGYLLLIILQQKRLSEVQKNFVNNMTHELKTPLASIQMSASVLKDMGEEASPKRKNRYLDIILKESTQLSAQVERVLQIAQSEKHNLPLRKERFIWQDVLHEIGESYNEILEPLNGEITLEMPEHNIHGNGDILHLTNALRNLIDNAIKYCDKTPKIKIILSLIKSRIVISVIDNGVGIPHQFHKHLFKKFYRVPTGNVHNVKGFGLGLNYVSTIIQSHHGRITLESDGICGTTFKMEFPYNK